MEEKIKKALGSKKVAEHEGFLRFSEKVRGVPRGTIVIGERIIPGYPKIKRVFVLERGIERNISSNEFIAEEKIDGYNVRAAMHEKKLLCFSRGGYLDHFAAEKLEDDPAVKKFFSDNPEWVLCGEMIGNTPHTDPNDFYDVRYYVFDIINKGGNFVGPLERRDLCKGYGLLPVPLVGTFKKNEIRRLKDEVKKLDRAGKEGIVIRGLGAEREMIKHVTPTSDINDLGEASSKIFDMPAGFMKQRVFRSAISLRELVLQKDKYALKLGEALYSGLIDALARGSVGEKFRVRVKEISTWEKILEGMGKDVEVRVDWKRKIPEGYQIDFTKTYKEGTKIVRRALEGHPQED
ncbi:MAG: RNA ligase [Candidatus Micrarchaeota archaeon]|nr:RNA ligase [Candidatus Micrarchaeota archaeon]